MSTRPRSRLRSEVLAGSLVVVAMALLLWSGAELRGAAFGVLLAAVARINYVVYRLRDGEAEPVAR